MPAVFVLIFVLVLVPVCVLVFDNPSVWNGITSDPTPKVPFVPDYVSKDADADDEDDIMKRAWRQN